MRKRPTWLFLLNYKRCRCEVDRVGIESTDHTTVLRTEAVTALVQKADGFYVDGTFGRGGHSSEILSRLSSEGRLLAIDKDPEACEWARLNFAADERFIIERGSFEDLLLMVERYGHVGKVAGVLLDLGVSSPQLDDPGRGFSFLRDGPLDMRMDPDRGQSAEQWLAVASAGEITRVLRDYGEEKHARRMARAVVVARNEAPITRTGQLANIIAAANPSWEKHKHPATRAFQAIRIFINRELEEIHQLLDSVLDVLAVGGRLVVISFHSLEDRIIKRFIRGHERPVVPKGLPIRDSEIERRMRSVGKAVKAGEQEVTANPRARSAVMRVAEKLV